MLIKVKVISKASQNKIIYKGDFLKIKVTNAPEKGRANQQVVKLLAKEFSVSPSQIEIIKGLTKKEKLVKINKEKVKNRK